MLISKKYILSLHVVLSICLLLSSCIINRPRPKDCKVVETTIVDILEGSTYDIVFYTSEGDRFYINRGLEQGLNLEDLNTSVLNKNVTLHLAKILGGSVVSKHIAQLATDENIIFTEFE